MNNDKARARSRENEKLRRRKKRAARSLRKREDFYANLQAGAPRDFERQMWLAETARPSHRSEH